jgi:hypothetical protein
MSRKTLFTVPALFLCVLAGFLTGCSSSSNKNNNNTTPSAIAATSGSSQSVTVSTPFTALVATVTDSSGNPVSGVSVTFTVVAGSSGASASFATGGSTDTETTAANGEATTSQALTANSTAGAFTVTANFSGNSGSPATYNLTNTAVAVTTTTYTFYASGVELPNSGNGDQTSYYAVAGAVTIDDTTGNVVGGEEDYNDGAGVTQGGASGALPITGGSLTVSATTGQGTLTLVTNNGTSTQFVGVSGTETLGVQFANTNHALIVQFDGTATSSGSLDLETTGSGAGNYSFLISGVDSGYEPVGYGGVYTVSSNMISGTADVNDDGTATPGNTLTGTSTSPDSFGRGSATVTINGTTLSLIYYQVGPEVLRLIDMDNGAAGTGFGNAAVGSAFGQGTTSGAANTFSASSLGTSVFALQGDPWGSLYAANGEFTTSPTAGTFSGVSDDNLMGTIGSATITGGSYTVDSNGYGTFIANAGGLPGIVGVGMYMTDPTLNLLDPNNTSNGGGEALLLDMDTGLSGGTGFILPQSDTTTTDFTGNYAFGAQEFFSAGEFDYVGQGSVSSSLALTGTGLLSDPFAAFDAGTGAEYSTATFSGTAVPDTTNVGRYTLPLVVTPNGTVSAATLNMVIYQGSADQLIWIDADTGSLGLGTLQQQGSLTGLPSVRKPVAKAVKHKQ